MTTEGNGSQGEKPIPFLALGYKSALESMLRDSDGKLDLESAAEIIRQKAKANDTDPHAQEMQKSGWDDIKESMLQLAIKLFGE